MELDKLSPYKIERTVNGNVVVFEIMAENQATAGREVTRFIENCATPLLGVLEYEEAIPEQAASWKDKYGIVGWAVYQTQTFRV